MHYEEGGKPFEINKDVEVNTTKSYIPVYLPSSDFDEVVACGTATLSENSVDGPVLTIKLDNNEHADRLRELMTQNVIDVSFAYTLKEVRPDDDHG